MTHRTVSRSVSPRKTVRGRLMWAVLWENMVYLFARRPTIHGPDELCPCGCGQNRGRALDTNGFLTRPCYEEFRRFTRLELEELVPVRFRFITEVVS